MTKSRPAVFLDRDGTINVEKEYLYRIEDWEWIPGAIEAIRRINEMNHLVIVVTNQAGIARGYYDEAAVHKLHSQIDELLTVEGARIDAYYFCPHHPQFGKDIIDCQCRKPAPGMLLAAQRDHDIDLSRSWMIGDKLLDIIAAQKAGVSPIMVMTGYGREEQSKLSQDIPCKSDLLGAIKIIEENNQIYATSGAVR